jgi:hypothetical protein
MIRLALAAALAWSLALPGRARADSVAAGTAASAQPDAAADEHPPDKSDTVEDGEHWRLETQNGIVHVWKPRGYDAGTAGTVIYLHGHRSTADSAWSEHKLAEQFRASGENALFIVPDSTSDGEQYLHWDSLGALRREVERRTGVARPPGELIVMGHSGAYRNIDAWLDDRDIDHVILLDAMYSCEDDFLDWIERSPDHAKKKLTIVSKETRRAALRFMHKIPASVGVTKIPDSFAGLTKRQKTAQVLNMRSQYEHMGIVTSGRVIPLVLQRTGLPSLRGGGTGTRATAAAEK